MYLGEALFSSEPWALLASRTEMTDTSLSNFWLWVIGKPSSLMVSAAQSATFQGFFQAKGQKLCTVCRHETTGIIAFRPTTAVFLPSFQVLYSSLGFYGKERNILRVEVIQPPNWYFFPQKQVSCYRYCCSFSIKDFPWPSGLELL